MRFLDAKSPAVSVFIEHVLKSLEISQDGKDLFAEALKTNWYTFRREIGCCRYYRHRLRIDLDCEEINKLVKTDGDTIPPIYQIKTKFTGATIFSKTVFGDKFLQIPLTKDSRKYMAFKISRKR